MMALCFTILRTPIERMMVEMAGRPSGMAATASDTAIMNMLIQSPPWIIPMTNIMAQMITEAMPSTLPSFSSLICIGVWVSDSPLSIPAIFPISVFIPVPTTIPFP